MPRLKTQQFIDHHDRLRQVWLDDQGAFAYLSPKEQWLLHLYYVPAEDLSDEQMLEHLGQVTKADRSLAHRAGKAYKVLVSGKDHGAVHGPVATKGKFKGHGLVTHTVVRPKPDTRRIASALLDIAREKLEHEKEAA